MFSKEDFMKYFDQISDIEKKMLDNVDELLSLLTTESAVETLEKIRNDEIKHIRIVKKISKLVENNNN